ncbi:hypothetical protein ACFPRL_24505 [Pseudoclavibacter helvolus]
MWRSAAAPHRSSTLSQLCASGWGGVGRLGRKTTIPPSARGRRRDQRMRES